MTVQSLNDLWEQANDFLGDEYALVGVEETDVLYTYLHGFTAGVRATYGPKRRFIHDGPCGRSPEEAINNAVAEVSEMLDTRCPNHKDMTQHHLNWRSSADTGRGLAPDSPCPFTLIGKPCPHHAAVNHDS